MSPCSPAMGIAVPGADARGSSGAWASSGSGRGRCSVSATHTFPAGLWESLGTARAGSAGSCTGSPGRNTVPNPKPRSKQRLPRPPSAAEPSALLHTPQCVCSTVNTSFPNVSSYLFVHLGAAGLSLPSLQSTNIPLLRALSLCRALVSFRGKFGIARWAGPVLQQPRVCLGRAASRC